MIKFEQYESSTGELTTIGSLNAIVGEGGTYRVASKKNFLSTKRVAILAKQKNGKSAIIVCSKEVSRLLRDKEITKEDLGTLPVFEVELEQEDEDTGEMETIISYFIGLSGGGDTSETEVKVTKASLKATPKEVVVDWSDLIA